MGQIKFIVGLVMAGLFAIAVVSYVTNFADDNNVAVDLGDDPEIATLKSNTESDLTSLKTSVNSSSKGFFQSTPEEGDELLRGGGQFKVGSGNAVSTVKRIVTIGFEKIFGKDTGFGLLLTSFTVILTFMATLYIWKAWKGNPD